MLDLIVRNARRYPEGDLADLAVHDGVFARIAPRLTTTARRELDAAGRLVTPPFVDAHMHLDTALTVGRPRHNGSGTLHEGIAIWNELRPTLGEAEIRANALETIRWQVAHGVLFQRCHVDVSDPDLVGLQALLAVRDEVRDLCEIQLVAFPQDGVHTSAERPALLRRALMAGCDVVGGAPHLEWSRDLGVRSLDTVFDLAREFDLPVDCHCDETDDPQSRFVEVMAAKARQQGWQGRVVGSHCTAMAAYPPAYLARLLPMLADAGVSVTVNPMVNALLQGRHDGHARHRGIAPIKELTAAGVTVAAGQDSVLDSWLPLGTGDLLAVAQLAVYLGQLSGHDELARALDLVTVNAARMLGIEDRYGLAEGHPASFVILDALRATDALRLLAPKLHVFRAGVEVAQTRAARITVRTTGGALTDVTFMPTG